MKPLVLVVEDLCAAATEAEHATSLELLRRIASVVKTTELETL